VRLRLLVFLWQPQLLLVLRVPHTFMASVVVLATLHCRSHRVLRMSTWVVTG
jgi:hypothetical protein